MAVWLYRVGGWLVGPLLALVTALHPRTRGHWAQRWALALPAVAPGAVVVHGSSVGEGRAAAAVCEALRAHPSRPVILRTASTDTGLATAAGHHVLCARPVDAPWVVARWLDRVRPRLVVLVDGDLWPLWMLACQARGIPVVVAGLRDGPGTRRLRRWLPGLFAALAEAVVLWAVQAEGLGLPGRVVPLGELKGLSPQATPVRLPVPTLVAGSTRAGDEDLLLAAWAALAERPLLVLAPRHPDRFDGVAQRLSDLDLPHRRWSQDPSVPAAGEVLLVDTVGDLPRFYPQAAAAFVGGTFTPGLGGHSPAEATAAGLPVVAGPERHASPQAWAQARLFEAREPEGLVQALAAALAAGPVGPASPPGPARLVALLDPWLGGPLPPARPLRPALRPLAWLYVAAVAARNAGWRLRRPVRAGVPVISVGGLGSGGAGKTPVVGALVAALVARGRRPAVIARGHGRSQGPSVRHAQERVGADTLGDELAMFAARGVLAVSAPDRVAGALVARSQGADVLVLDDGFQHRRLARDLDVVVVDPRWPAEGGPLPVGEAREGPRALSRADLLWLSGPGDLPGAPEGLARARSETTPVAWLHRGHVLPLDGLPPGPVTAVAGIARPGRFLEQLIGLGVDVRTWQTWPDHHPWNPAECEVLRRQAEQGVLVCTEKDLARLPPDLPVFALRVELSLLAGADALERLLDRALS